MNRHDYRDGIPTKQGRNEWHHSTFMDSHPYIFPNRSYACYMEWQDVRSWCVHPVAVFWKHSCMIIILLIASGLHYAIGRVLLQARCHCTSVQGWLVCVWKDVEWALYIESNYSVCGCIWYIIAWGHVCCRCKVQSFIGCGSIIPSIAEFLQMLEGLAAWDLHPPPMQGVNHIPPRLHYISCVSLRAWNWNQSPLVLV